MWETDLEDPKDGCDAYQDCSKRGGRARKRALEIESRRHGAQVGLSKREEGSGLLGLMLRREYKPLASFREDWERKLYIR